MQDKINYFVLRLKPFATFLIIICVIALLGFLCNAETDLRRILANPNGSIKDVQISDILNGITNQSLYVRLSGTAYYDVGLASHYNNSPVIARIYYLLLDTQTGTAVIVLSPTTYVPVDSKEVTVTGILAVPDSQMKPVLQEVAQDLWEENGIQLSQKQFILEGEEPPPAAVRQYIGIFLLGLAAVFIPSVGIMVYRVELPHEDLHPYSIEKS